MRIFYVGSCCAIHGYIAGMEAVVELSGRGRVKEHGFGFRVVHMPWLVFHHGYIAGIVTGTRAAGRQRNECV